MMRILLVVMTVFFIATSSLHGQVYQWVDENGVKHFSNTPPPDGVTDVRTYEEVKDETGTEPSGRGEPQRAPVAEAGDETQAQPTELPPEESSVEGEGQDTAEIEDAGDAEDAGEVEESDELEETVEPDIEDRPDLEESQGPENPTSGRIRADELIGQERDRLEVRMAQLNRQLAEAQTARDRGSDDDAQRWNKRVEQLRAQIEKERNRSEARIEQIRSQYGSEL